MKLWVSKSVNDSHPWCFEGWNTSEQDELFDWLRANLCTDSYLVTTLSGRWNFLPAKTGFGFRLQLRNKRDAALLMLLHEVL